MTDQATNEARVAESVPQASPGWQAKIINGRAVSRALIEECRQRVRGISKKHGVTPGLAVVLVGDDAASAVYVKNKERACATAGIKSRVIRLPADSKTEAVLDALDLLKLDPAVNGIIVQLPLSGQIETQRVLERIPAEKDVDGFHLYNVGGLILGESVSPPCTPEGVIRLIDSARVELEGANVVIVGASNVVGKPMALMALRREATVTVCHAKTRSLAHQTRLADVLIVAAGHPCLITADMVKPGAVVIDVGISRLPDGTVTGDVAFEEVAAVASQITPVPGGVGPMTVAVLILNTVRAVERSLGLALRPDDEQG